MKISLLTDGIFPYVIGGMQKHSFYLVKYLAKRGVYVDLYHTNQSKLDINKLELFSEEEKKFIRSFVVPFPKAGKLPGHYLKASFLYSSAIFDILKKQGPADFIYAKGFSAWKLIEEKKKGFECAPIGVKFHGYEMFQKAPNLKSYLSAKLLLQKPVLYNNKNADYIFSYGGKITDIIKKLNIPSSKIIEIPTGIENSWLATKENLIVNERVKFLFVGRFERRKGVEELNKALLSLKENPNFEFHFIGPIPESNKLKLAHVFYHGSIMDAEIMKKKVKEMDVLVCPSHSEGMPNVIMESMASGLAVIATDVGAVKLMVDNENGVLIDNSDPSVIVLAMKRMISLESKDLMLMKQKSIEKVKSQFLWEHIIDDTIAKISEKIKA
ncbi:MAG: glycosyltransferase family 4 protein [Bacteroidota bacterium]|nr:glycosyltransferase family 4 protein [Bacteroidota bacterium]